MCASVCWPGQGDGADGLCIAALLISNVVGWAHFGCVQTASSCCLQSDTKAPVGKVRSESGCHHSCGTSQDHRHAGKDDQETDGQLPTNQSDSTNHDCPEKHDSDRCSICQSFFASRNAAFTMQAVAVSADDQPQLAVLFPGHVRLQECRYGGISVRGPPRS